MAMLVGLCLLAFLSSEAYAVQLISQPTVSLVVEQGHGVILPFNYTLDQAESASVLTVSLHLNDTADNGTIIYYNEFRGDILENRTEGYLVGRPDVQILSSPRTYVGLLIKRTMLSDTGKYIWSIRIGGAKTSDVPIELIVGNKPESVSLVSRDEGGPVYMLTCTVTGGILSSNITILNGTEVIHTSPASTTTINVTVEFPSVFYCVGKNVLGSTNKSLALPDPTTTMSPSTSTVATTGDNTASTTTKHPDKNQTEDNTAMALGTPGNPPNTALIVGVICGCVGGIVIIVILVYVFKKKGHKTKPGKKVLTLEQRVVEGNDNTCEQQENTTKLSTEQEQEEKQQQNVKGPRGNTKPAGGDGSKKRDADSNAEDTEELEERQQRNVENLQYADLDLRPRGNTKPTGGDGRNKLVLNDDSTVEYAEVRKM